MSYDITIISSDNIKHNIDECYLIIYSDFFKKAFRSQYNKEIIFQLNYSSKYIEVFFDFIKNEGEFSNESVLKDLNVDILYDMGKFLSANKFLFTINWIFYAKSICDVLNHYDKSFYDDDSSVKIYQYYRKFTFDIEIVKKERKIQTTYSYDLVGYADPFKSNGFRKTMIGSQLNFVCNYYYKLFNNYEVFNEKLDNLIKEKIDVLNKQKQEILNKEKPLETLYIVIVNRLLEYYNHSYDKFTIKLYLEQYLKSRYYYKFNPIKDEDLIYNNMIRYISEESNNDI